MKEIKIALVGNPNSGKTTLFNNLTGSNQYVGNWPGVTVERKEGKYKKNKNILIQDLPGIYSLSPYTLEEIITRQYLLENDVDVIVNIIDGTNIERNLYLTTQLLELNIPVVVAINMMDLVEKNKDKINFEKLSEKLNCSVVNISAINGNNVIDVIDSALKIAVNKKQIYNLYFDGEIEKSLKLIELQIKDTVESSKLRWYATKVFESDKNVLETLKLNFEQKELIDSYIKKCEDLLNDDGESIIIGKRYEYIENIIKLAVKKNEKRTTSTSDKIDRVVTNRLLAFPIFIAVMFVVYYISITTVGDYLTGFTNDTLFGTWIIPNVTLMLEGLNIAPWLTGLISDGIIGGVGAVLGFVPQMLVLFLMLSILEDCGYMTRVAFIMDRLFRKFGLSGKSFIPMLIGSGCSIPGIMASRTIEQDRDRKMTIMTTSFIPCGAKMPIIALIGGALFSDAWWMAPVAYFIGVLAVIISGIILKKMKVFAGKPAPFIMELPAYHIPLAKNILKSTWERGFSFIKRAGTVILLSAVVLWFLQSFGIVEGSLVMVEDNNTSLLAIVGKMIAPIFAPLGFGTWQASVGTITGLIAKENVVGTFGVLYGFAEVSEAGNEFWNLLATDFTQLSAFSFMIFNLLCAPCFAAMGAIKREMSNGKWTWFAIGYMTVFAYSSSLVFYQLGMLITTGVFSIMTLIALIILAGFIYLLLRKNKYENI